MCITTPDRLRPIWRLTMWTFLSGNKTYIGAISGGLLGIIYSLGYLDDRTAGIIASIITAWTGVAIRSAVAKNGKGR